MYFLGFYTEGEPHDRCYNLTSSASEIRTKLKQYFDYIFLFSKRDLKKLPGSDLFCNEYPEELAHNPNANFIGYFDFKPFLIDYVLRIIPKNSLLLYHDTNFEKHDCYWDTDWPNLQQIAEYVLGTNQSDFFIPFECHGTSLKHQVKFYTLNQLFPDPDIRRIVQNCRLVNAAKLIFRNTEKSRDFVKDWMKLVLRKDLITRSPNPNPLPDFMWSCGDQDVLNCLVYQYVLDRKLPISYPRFGFNHRTISRNMFELKNDLLSKFLY
jgi:hypothetical protein